MKTTQLLPFLLFVLLTSACTKEQEENDSEDSTHKSSPSHSVLTDAVKGPLEKAKAAANQVEESDEETAEEANEADD